MSANVDLNIDKIGTKLVEPIEKEPDKPTVNGEKFSASTSSSSVSPSLHSRNPDDLVPKDSSSPDSTEISTTQEKVINPSAAPKEGVSSITDENSSLPSEILNKGPVVDDDERSNDSLIIKFSDYIDSAVGATGTRSPGLGSGVTHSDESNFSISLDSSDSPIHSVRDSNSCSELRGNAASVKRACNDEDDNSIIFKKFKINDFSDEKTSNIPVLESLSGAGHQGLIKLPESDETVESLKDKTGYNKQAPGITENSVTEEVQNRNSSSQIKEIATKTEISALVDHPVLSNDFELSNSNHSLSETCETVFEGLLVKSPVIFTDPAEDSGKSSVPLENSVSSKMKGEVVTAPMPIPETRSPMIHIPASIVSEFMNSESSLSPVIGKPAKKSTSPVNNYLDEITKSSDGSDGETVIINGSSKSVGAAEKSQDVAVGVNTDSNDEGGLSSAPLIGSTPPDSRPAKPASPAALSNKPIPVSAAQLGASDKMEISNDLDSSEKPVSSPLTNGKYESSALCASSDPLGDISNFGSTVSDDPMSRPLLTPLTGTVATPVLLADDELPQSTDITELAPVRTSYVPSSNSSTSTTLTNPTTTTLLDISNSVSPDALEINDSEKNSLKRSLPAEDGLNNKKLRLSPVTENQSASPEIQAIEDDASKALVDAEVQKLRHTASKLRKLKRKDLENMIIELFMNKVLHNHELGKYKTLCEKLESTLECNRKKAAQFHKELDDLRKVTRKLQEEHQNRKDHLVTPIKIKRSVGIQAAPHIIQKGIAAACGESGKSHGRSPHSHINGASSQQSMVVVGNPNIGTSVPAQPGSTHNSMRTSFGGGRSGMVNTVNGSPGDRRVSSQLMSSQMNSSNKSNAVIDLTDEEESRTTTTATTMTQQVSKTHQNLVKVTTASGFVSLPTSSGAAQYVLVPSSAAGAGNTVVVATANVATNSLAGSSNTSARLLMPGNSSVMNSKTSTASLLAPPVPTMVQQQQSSSPHPAPLPRTAPQQVVGGAKQLPPQPTLKLSHKDNSIVLSWTMAKTSEHEAIASYQLFAYQESNQPPSPSLWKKVGSVKALELPMACTLTQFMPGHRYHFAVRAVDAKSRLGPFSDPRSIRLEK